MTISRRFRAALASLAVLPTFGGAALAHPHVFADAKLDVLVDGDRTVKALRHLWRFDDLFSSTVLMQFDTNSDLKLDDAELEAVASTVEDSLAEFDYFQIVTADGKDVKMNRPPKMMANFDDNRLILFFESTPKTTLRLAGKIDFGVYDPTFYTAVDFLDDSDISVEKLPQNCTRKVIRPDPQEAIAQNQSTLTEAFFNDPAGNDLSKIFATKLELNCS